MNYKEQYAAYLQRFEQDLQIVCEEYLPQSSQVSQAARYSLLAGGKRIRAILCMASCEMLGGDVAAASRFACAVEMLHCFSLIHDDLPCMDDDDYRRGKPSCHKAYGEAQALLAGDALLTEAFEVIAETQATPESRIEAVRQLSLGGGSRGMILGQELDMAFENQVPDETQLRMIHKNKTGALINAAVQMGLCAAPATQQDRHLLEQYAFGIGLVFQIVDDVLDITSTSEELGKPVGSDLENGKVTFASLYGPQKAMELARDLNEKVCTALEQQYGPAAEFLVELARQLVDRRN
ncbi:polyprenyl synthetase family protein [uncultured Allofournierella sp.]|uniref:polyprenyl synthetase family protein n=1 Tax=uncultured Allofournierella sp. TaxID=1940258 RepID=UPI003751D689